MVGLCKIPMKNNCDIKNVSKVGIHREERRIRRYFECIIDLFIYLIFV